MYSYAVYRYKCRSKKGFTRLGSILGYDGPNGSGSYFSLLQEAKRLFAAGEDDIILLGPSPIETHEREFRPAGSGDPAA